MTVRSFSANHYWLLIGTTPGGPFDAAGIRGKLGSGEITAKCLACPVGASRWQPLDQLPEFASPHGIQDLQGKGAVSPATLAQIGQPIRTADFAAQPVVRKSWNPATIAWLGLLFSPIWAGIMAAVNGHRLNMEFPVWRPIAIGVASLLLSAITGIFVEAYLVHLAIYLGAVWLIWHLDLRLQGAAFSTRPAIAHSGWVVPTLAGTPLALAVLFGFVIAPLIPLEPREVCERFANARTESQAQKYTTLNLRPALSVLFKSNGPEEPWSLEFTGESAAPVEVGGYLVGYRLLLTRDHCMVEGVFHLVMHGADWKIDDMFIAARNREPIEPWFSLAREYPALQPATPHASLGTIPVATDAQTVRTPSTQKQWYESPVAVHVAGKGIGALLSSKAAKSIGAVLLAAAVITGAFFKKLFRPAVARAGASSTV